MTLSQNVEASLTSRRSRFLMPCLSAIVLGFSTLPWVTFAGVSKISAAEAVPDDDSISTIGDELDTDQPAGAVQRESPVVEYFPRPTKDELKIIVALEKLTSLEFVDESLEKCISFLRGYHKVNIWIDRQSVIDEGVALDQPITLKLAGVTLRSVLKLLLEPVQLTYVVEDNVLKITTCAKANEKLLTRTYPVRDLYQGPDIIDRRRVDDKDEPPHPTPASRPGDLETAILKTIDPESWDDQKGPGSMTYVRQSGSLVIRQSASAHERILQLLRDLRQAKRVGHVAPAPQSPPSTGWKLRGPKRAETYSLVGIMDLDGDGDGDSGLLREVIRAIGASIDNEVDEHGVLRVGGSIPDDGRPRITEKTKFVVVGRIPQVADTADPDEIATSLKIAESLKVLGDEARAHGVRIVRLGDFLHYLGYERSDTKRARPGGE
jgi:hypothetical protein